MKLIQTLRQRAVRHPLHLYNVDQLTNLSRQRRRHRGALFSEMNGVRFES